MTGFTKYVDRPVRKDANRGHLLVNQIVGKMENRHKESSRCERRGLEFMPGSK